MCCAFQEETVFAKIWSVFSCRNRAIRYSMNIQASLFWYIGGFRHQSRIFNPPEKGSPPFKREMLRVQSGAVDGMDRMNFMDSISPFYSVHGVHLVHSVLLLQERPLHHNATGPFRLLSGTALKGWRAVRLRSTLHSQTLTLLKSHSGSPRFRSPSWLRPGSPRCR